MKNSILSIVFLASILFACNSGKTEKPADETPSASGSEQLAMYADSITLVAEQLETKYNDIISEVGRHPEKKEEIKAKNMGDLTRLENRMAELNLKITQLLQNKQVTEDEYQAVVLDLDFSGVSEGSNKLEMLGIMSNDPADGLRVD